MSEINIEKYKDKGLSGLANLGNTCYINSCMQILSHCYILNDFLEILDTEKLNNINDSLLLKEWKDLKNLMWSKNCIVSPNRFIYCVNYVSKMKNIELFSGFAQNDLPEFLMFIIDCFHNSLKRQVIMNISGKIENIQDILANKCYQMLKEMYSETYSELLNMFYGIHVSLIISKDKENILSVKPEPFSIINLSLPEDKNECSIYDCFDIYTTEEYMEGINAWYNEDNNNKEDVYKTLKFWNLPEILIIDIKRFNNFNKKINTLVNTPIENLDLSKYIVGYDKEKYKYNLFGICNHTGNSLGGHYTSFVKNANNKWYHYNDTDVTEYDISKIITNKAYSFFYKKI